MLPLAPPSVIHELSVFRDSEARAPRHNRMSDPDGMLTMDSLPPDPLFVALRQTFTSGPIALLMAWMRRKEEAADDSSAPANASSVVPAAETAERATPGERPEPEARDIAA